MEPGISREIPAFLGDPKRLLGREEETRGEETEGGKAQVQGSAEMFSSAAVGEDSAERRNARCGKIREDKQRLHFDEKDEASKYEDELDPRIQEELEHLNLASEEINKLELQLEDARSSYRKILTDSARKLNAQGSQLGACIEKARPYYEARRLAKEAQQETQKAALRYERAVSMHTAAREMVYVAEQGLLADKNNLDPTWQEMLNHSTAKVNEAEEERLRSEREHQRVTQLCQDAETHVQTLQKTLKKVILKSKSYFELKAQFNHILEEHKAKVLELEEEVAKVKRRYSVALRNLEQISEQIHAQRERKTASRGHLTVEGRSSPIGAESEVQGAMGFHIGNCVEVSGIECDWADGEKTRLWVERHRESGWGQKEPLEAEQLGSDSTSVISLQTIASDLEKCDSVEHLVNLSDGRSVLSEDCDMKCNERLVNKKEVTQGLQQEKGVVCQKKQEFFVKQHQRSFSL
ncbi:SH3 domain-binding protein 5-like [Anableps anableps]